jgi:hypothetical protein
MSRMIAPAVTSNADVTALFSASGWWGVLVYVLLAVSLWRVFSKAGYPGILAIIPIVNLFVLTKVAGMSAWWTLLYIVPIVNIVFTIIVAFRVGRNFGKGGGFSFFLLWLFWFIGYLILGFGSSRYRKA